MAIYFFNKGTILPEFNQPELIKWIEMVIREQQKSAGEISFIFCNDNYLLDINRQYLNHDYFTDVITFDYGSNNEISGDIFISMDMIRYNAKKFNISHKKELYRVIIHGVLHLCGYDDKTHNEKAIMTKLEDIALSHIIF